MTPAVAEIRKAVLARFPQSQLISLGICNRRYIARSKTWSQHSWCNAWDISVPLSAGVNVRYAVLDDVAAYLRAQKVGLRLPIATVLWRVRDHYNHIHVDGFPKRTGTPPLNAGEMITDMDIIAAHGASGEWVKPFQIAINRAVPTAQLVIDGRYGDKTRDAVEAYQRSAELVGLAGTQVGKIDSRTAFLLLRERGDA